jgi:hypothetical protein
MVMVNISVTKNVDPSVTEHMLHLCLHVFIALFFFRKLMLKSDSTESYVVVWNA